MANLLGLILLILSFGAVDALITFKDVIHLTNLTTRCFRNITRDSTFDLPSLVNQESYRSARSEADFEVLVATSLSLLGEKLNAKLNVSMDASSKDIFHSRSTCSTIIQDHHSFLASTTALLQAVDEKQQMNRWSRNSQVFKILNVMQALWASRRMNKQNLSFIEQQISMYGSTDCFGKNEVLRRCVEVVEYMNDILDSFL